MKNEFNGLGMSLGNLSRLSHAKTRSISSENPTGEKGKAGMAPLVKEWQVNANKWLKEDTWKRKALDHIQPGELFTLADIEGQGAIQSIWITGTLCRFLILRIYWDDQEIPSVECPITDFFCIPWQNWFKNSKTTMHFPQVNSLPVVVNPLNGCNSYWEMPFRKRCRITLENIHAKEEQPVYFQINYALTEVPEDVAYFHAQFRRVNPLPDQEVYTVVDNIKGQGHYVGTSLGVGLHCNGWWGEGEMKFYMDGDGEFPTICGTGTEDYFCGSYCWDVDNKYKEYTTPFSGMHQTIRPKESYQQVMVRQSMYRWHVMDPIRFENDLRVTLQSIGGPRELGGYFHGMHDFCSVARWYQTLPSSPFPALPDITSLEII